MSLRLRLTPRWRRRLLACLCLVLAGAPLGAGMVEVVGGSLGVLDRAPLKAALGGAGGALGAALLLIGWWILADANGAG